MAQRPRGWLLLILVLTSIMASLPRPAASPAVALPRTPALLQSATLPAPGAAHSTGLPASAVDQSLRATYQASHTLDSAVDGSFTAVRTQTGAYPRPIALSGFRASSTTIRIPPGIRDSLEVDLALTQSGSPFGARMRFAVAPAGTTSWSNDLEVLRLEGSGTVQTERLQVSLDQSVPADQPMDLRLECLGDYLISCRWENLRFFSDVPGWTPLPSNRHRTNIRFGVRADALGAIAPRSGPFLGVQVTSFTWDDLEHQGPRVAFPSFSATDPVTVSVDWARTLTDRTSQEAPGGAELRFLPDGQTDSALIASVNSVTPTVSWTTLRQDVPTRFAGLRGALIIRTSGRAAHDLALDGITFWQHGQPLRIVIPPDQTVSACGADPELAGAIQCMHGDPVNTFSGAYVLRAADLELASAGPPLALERVYVSLLADPARQPVSALGPGWRHSFAARLTLPSAQPGGEPGTLIYESSDGNRLRFRQLPGDRLEALPGVRATLSHAADGSYTLTTRDQRVQRFDAEGRLVEQRTAASATQTLRYYPSGHAWAGQLEQVLDTGTGRSLRFSYLLLASGALRLAAVTDSANRQIGYRYTPDGDLQSASDLHGGTTSYSYAAGHLLATITDPLGQITLRNSYDAERRVVEQVEGGDGATALTTRYRYETTAYGPATTITQTRADATADVRIDHYRPDGSIEYQERNGQLLQYTAFDGSFAPSVRVDGNGQATRVQHTASGLPTRMEDAAGQITSLGYDRQQRPVVQIAPFPGPLTELTYDGAGNLTRMLRTGQDQLEELTTYGYTSANQLAEIRRPDGTLERFTYDALGQLQATTVGAGTPLAQATSFSYDALGRIIARTTAAGTPEARRDATQYNPDGTIATLVANEDDGVFDPAEPDRDVITGFGYDRLGRQVWTADPTGRIDATHYDARGRVDWTIQNLDPLELEPQTGQVRFRPFAPAAPDRNVATLYRYDALGHVDRITETGLLSGSFDPATRRFSAASERVTEFAYDAQGRLAITTVNARADQPVGGLPDVNLQTLRSYDGAGNLTWQRDPAGRWTRTEYDALSRPITTTVNYENGDPLTVDAANRTWTDGSDTDLRSVTRYTPTGQVAATTENAVDGDFQATEPITDRVTTYRYDGLLQLQETIHTLDPTQSSASDTNQRMRRTYDQTTGRLSFETDPLGRSTAYQEDDLGRIVLTTANCTLVATACAAFDGAGAPDRNRPTATVYDARDRVVATVDPLGQRTATVYDGLDRPIARILNQQNPAQTPAAPGVNVTSRTSYDAVGRVLSQTDPLGAISRTGYDGLGRVTSQTDWGGRVTRFGYDGTGTLRWRMRPGDRLAVVAVDGLGRPVATTENYGDGVVSAGEPSDEDLTTTVRYDVAGRVIETVDVAGRITRFRYDLRDRLVAVQENVLSGQAALLCQPVSCNIVTVYRYDRLGNRTAITDANGHTRRFSYDAADRQVSATDALGQITRWSYDAAGRVTLQRDPRGPANDLRSTYDDLDRLIGVTAANLDAPITIRYDASARERRLSDGIGTTTFHEDALGRITAVDAPGTGTVSYSYNGRGQRTELRYPAGPTITYRYGLDGQLAELAQGDAPLVAYSYDSATGRMEQATRANGTVTTWAYDRADRLLQLRTSLGATTVSAFGSTVNRLGQRTVVRETLGGQTRTVSYRYDPLGRMIATTASDGTSTGYGYDRVGNRVSTSVNGVEVVTRSYNAANQVNGWSYDAVGNLTADGVRSYRYDALGRLSGSGGTTYRYNGDGVLVARLADGSSTSYTQDLAAPLSQVLQITTPTRRTDLVYGIGRVAALDGATRSWEDADSLGSVRQTLSDTGGVQQTLRYDPWGLPEGGAAPSVFGFTGELYDADAALLHLRARWYQPGTGTLLGRDPFAGFAELPASLQPYQYAYNDPVRYADPSGRNPALCLVPAVVDGPLPIGDAVAVACLGAYVTSAGAGIVAGQAIGDAVSEFTTDPSFGAPYTTGGAVAPPPLRPHTGSPYPLLPPWQLPPTTYDRSDQLVCTAPPTTGLPPFLRPPVARPGPTLLPGQGPLILQQSQGFTPRYMDIDVSTERYDSPRPKAVKLGLRPTLANTVPGVIYERWSVEGLIPYNRSYGFWESFSVATRNATAINFNLDGIDPGLPSFWEFYRFNPSRYTYRELDAILGDPDLLAKTTFYVNEQPLGDEQANNFIRWWSSLGR